MGDLALGEVYLDASVPMRENQARAGLWRYLPYPRGNPLFLMIVLLSRQVSLVREVGPFGSRGRSHTLSSQPDPCGRAMTKCGLNNMSRQNSRLSHASLRGRSTSPEAAPVLSRKANLRVVALGAVLALGGCSFADEALWPAVDKSPATTQGSGTSRSFSDLPALGSTTASGLSVSSAASTGTVVGSKIQQIRSDLSALQGQTRSHSSDLEAVRNETRTHAIDYHTTKATVEAALQVGTTPGNPRLIQQWNEAQSELDLMARDINNMTSLATQIAGDASTANYLLETTQATFGLSGAVDQDHSQLEVLQDETRQTVVLINRLLSELRADTSRQTSYLANERANLTSLSNSIKHGQLFGRSLASPLASINAPVATTAPVAVSGKLPSSPALMVIRFDRPNVQYANDLYTVLTQVLDRRPEATFKVVAVAPSKGSPAAMQMAQYESRQHAESVYQLMNEMGLPAERVELSSTTSSDARTNEVRIFLR